MISKKIAIVAIRPVGRETGGAERFYAGLAEAFNAAGMQSDLIEVLSDESSFETIKESYLRCYDLELSAYDVVISTKSPSYLVRHPRHICYLVHTMRVFYDMFDNEFRHPTACHRKQREFIQLLDTGALNPSRTRKVFCIGHEVGQRLLKWNRIESEVLHPALLSESFRSGEYQYIFMPGRLHRWKRVDLIIEAFKYVKNDIRLKIAGIGEDESRFRHLAANDDRIEFLGSVSDQVLVDLYSNALAVPFVPLREDYGYVTLEAFRSEKPVITCHDSGETTYFVKNRHSGFVCEPTPRIIAQKIDYLCKHPEKAKEMGENGKKAILDIKWDNIIERLAKYF